jgi:hypothetical protein
MQDLKHALDRLLEFCGSVPSNAAAVQTRPISVRLTPKLADRPHGYASRGFGKVRAILSVETSNQVWCSAGRSNVQVSARARQPTDLPTDGVRSRWLQSATGRSTMAHPARC